MASYPPAHGCTHTALHFIREQEEQQYQADSCQTVQETQDNTTTPQLKAARGLDKRQVHSIREASDNHDMTRHPPVETHA